MNTNGKTDNNNVVSSLRLVRAGLDDLGGCSSDCPYQTSAGYICGTCCQQGAGRKCPAFFDDYNGCGPSGPGNYPFSLQGLLQGLQDFVAALIGMNTLDVNAALAPVCDMHDVCFETPGKTFEQCNTELGSNGHNLCKALFPVSSTNDFGSIYRDDLLTKCNTAVDTAYSTITCVPRLKLLYFDLPMQLHDIWLGFFLGVAGFFDLMYW